MTRALLVGFFSSAQHVLAGPDHLAAVAPLAASSPRPWQSGLLWGLGHLASLLFIGLALWGLRLNLPIEAISRWSETLVGFVLIALGLWVLLGRSQAHAHGGTSFAVGFVHGLAGASHWLAMLPLLALESLGEGLLFVLGLAAGTLLSMGLFTTILGRLCRGPHCRQQLTRWAAVASLLVGAFWVVAGPA